MEGIDLLAKKFIEFDVALDIKNQVMSETQKNMIEEAKTKIIANRHADLGITKIIKLSYSFYKKFVDNLSMRDKAILIYDSRKTPKLRKVFINAYKTMMKNLPEGQRKYFIFATYDLAHNTRHGLQIDHQDLPILRFYRKEEFSSKHYTDRFLVTDKKQML